MWPAYGCEMKWPKFWWYFPETKNLHSYLLELLQEIITAFLNSTRPAMSKTSSDFGFFCDVNQNLRTWRLLVDLLGNRSLLQRVQKVVVCDLWLVDFDPFCVFVVFELQSFWKRAVSFPILCLVNQGDLCFDVLLCDVNFLCFSPQVFLPSYWNMASLDSQGEIVPIEETQSENESVHSRQH